MKDGRPVSSLLILVMWCSCIEIFMVTTIIRLFCQQPVTYLHGMAKYSEIHFINQLWIVNYVCTSPTFVKD
jgi:hypothetical protein